LESRDHEGDLVVIRAFQSVRLLDGRLQDGLLLDDCLLDGPLLDDRLLDGSLLGDCLLDGSPLDDCLLDGSLLGDCLLDGSPLDDCPLDGSLPAGELACASRAIPLDHPNRSPGASDNHTSTTRSRANRRRTNNNVDPAR
jgi:hypothetical protein